MNKVILLRSFIAGCTTIMQFWIIVVVFHNDFVCRKEYYNTNSQGNKMACIVSLNSITQWHCKCQFFYASNFCANNQCTEVDYWMRVFDDGTLALASFIFIALLIIECYRS